MRKNIKGWGHPLYNRWNGMVQRCTNPKAISYPSYGAKGVTVCERWMTFKNFLADMGPSFKAGLWIERKENGMGYSPDNCFWSTPEDQQNNRTNNHLVSYMGETLTIRQWEKRLGVRNGLIKLRLWRGWSVERALKFKTCLT